jgi:hypothetical protein
MEKNRNIVEGQSFTHEGCSWIFLLPCQLSSIRPTPKARSRSWMVVLLPQPLSPTNATFWPATILGWEDHAGGEVFEGNSG